MSRRWLRCKGIQVGGLPSSHNDMCQIVNGKSLHLSMADGRQQGEIWHGLQLITLHCGDAGAPLTGFLLLYLAHIAKGGPKMGVMDFLVVEVS